MRAVVWSALAFCSLLVVACDENEHPAASAGPSITITSPANNAAVSADANNPDVPINFTVKNFTLQDIGTCAGAPLCGHVEVFVDGTACNDPSGKPYNNAGSSSPITAGLDYCPTIAGAHKISLELHNDDLTAVKDATGAVIASTINVTASPTGGGVPDGGVADGGQADGGQVDGGVVQCPGGGAPVATTSVAVADFHFTPACITVPVGSTVTWTNSGMPIHTVTSDTGAPVSFNSGALGSGGTFHFTFTSPGVVGYHCIPHQSIGMVGTVIVK
ncbi:MAG TPA: plastocyanin/azurin family copper-binding protein [Polyangia bacterium]|jgi:plastocyanin